MKKRIYALALAFAMLLMQIVRLYISLFAVAMKAGAEFLALPTGKSCAM